jgi:protein-S-isoprenylcysteine O-methyltransferase Ste14
MQIIDSGFWIPTLHEYHCMMVIHRFFQADHQLITSGVFSLMRHPSYVGWFYWSVGTQVSTQKNSSLTRLT